MGRNRYRYDHKGNLTGFYSDDSPFDRMLKKVGCFFVPVLFAAPFIVGVFSSEREDQDVAENGDLESISEIAEDDSIKEIQSLEAKPVISEAKPRPRISEPIRPNLSASAGLRELTGEQQSAVQQALLEAFESGEAVRWQADGLEGYAIPSVSANSEGCRAVSYSVDAFADWQSPAEIICP